jgi:hypothetical protein
MREKIFWWTMAIALALLTAWIVFVAIFCSGWHCKFSGSIGMG